ncbi:MAG: hypothetical protein HZA82_07650 [Thaumarchaeota archaeon]|nr:hypothetical protein [Nitrososphaerota archaeon]
MMIKEATLKRKRKKDGHNLVQGKLVIRNVIITSDLQQKIDVTKFTNHSWGTYDSNVYGGRCGYVKIPEMRGRVIIFPSGKMISVGANSVKKAISQLNEAKFYFVRAKLIDDVKLKTKIRNMVATTFFPLEGKFTKTVQLKNAIYEPEQFPGIILKSINSINYLIFNSGKIVITGAKSKNELSQARFEINKKLEMIQ